MGAPIFCFKTFCFLDEPTICSPYILALVKNEVGTVVWNSLMARRFFGEKHRGMVTRWDKKSIHLPVGW